MDLPGFHVKLFLAVAAAALLAIPTVSAQSPTGLTMEVGPAVGTFAEDNYNVIPYAGNATFPVTVTVGCGTVVIHSDNPKVTVSIDPMPAWLTAAPMEFDFTPSQEVLDSCATGQGFASQTLPFPIVLKESAPGIVEQTLNFTAKMSSATSPANEVGDAKDTAAIQVQFHPSYTITPSVSFPLKVDGCKATFDVVLANSANAPSMIMIEEKRESTGSLAGIGPETFDPAAHNGTHSVTQKIVFSTPPGNWTTAQVTFKAYSHFLINPGYGAGEFRGQQNITWTFTKGSTEGCQVGPDNGTTTAPSPAPMLAAYVAVLALGAVVASRRRK